MRTTVIAVVVVSLAAARLEGQAGRPSSAWNVTVGGGAIVVPSYAGSNERLTFPFPLVKVIYRDRVYFGPSASGTGLGAGVNAIHTRQLAVAGEVGFQQDRPTSRGRGLAGMDDRSFVGTAGVSLNYALGPLGMGLNATQGLNDGAGILAGGQMSVTLPVTERTILVTGFGATFADRQQMRREFGVTAAEAGRRQALLDAGDQRLAADAGTPYSPAGGLRQVSLSVTLIRFLSANWAVIGIGGVDRLGDEAARSSVVQQRTQGMGGVALGYRF